MAIVFPNVNGNTVSFANIEIAVGTPTLIVNGFTDLSYTQTLEPGDFRANRPEKLGRTVGEHNIEGGMTVVKRQYLAMIQAMGNGYMEEAFDITCTYRERTNPELMTDVLFGCRITSEEDSHSQGTDALVVVVSLNIMIMSRNGLFPIVDQIGT